MKHTLTLILSLFLWNASAQLHHQMLSSQGSTSKTEKGVIVTQTTTIPSTDENSLIETVEDYADNTETSSSVFRTTLIDSCN